MAKIENGKIAVYKGKYPLNMAVKKGDPIVKQPGKEFTAAELASISDELFKEMSMKGGIVVLDKPKAAAKEATAKEGDK